MNEEHILPLGELGLRLGAETGWAGPSPWRPRSHQLLSPQADEPRARSIGSFQQLRAWTVTSGDLGAKLSNSGPPFEGPGVFGGQEEPAKGQNHMELVSERARGHAGPQEGATDKEN